MTLRDDLIDRVRDWLIATTDATDGKVIDAGAKGPRPVKPYCTVRLTAQGNSNLHGPAERIDGNEDGLTSDDPANDNPWKASTPQAAMRERRQAVVSLQGYGSTSADWFDQAQIRLDRPDSLELQQAADIVLLLQAEPQDISALLDTEEESRYSFELLLRYQYRDEPVDRVELQRTEATIDLERYPADPDTLDASFALDEDGNPI